MPLGEQLGASGRAQTITSHDLLHRRCGVDPKEDILAAIAAMPPAERVAAQAVVAEMEAEGRRTLELMPGAVQLARWLEAHGVPTAIVTRNTAATVAHLATHAGVLRLRAAAAAPQRGARGAEGLR